MFQDLAILFENDFGVFMLKYGSEKFPGTFLLKYLKTQLCRFNTLCQIENIDSAQRFHKIDKAHYQKDCNCVSGFPQNLVCINKR